MKAQNNFQKPQPGESTFMHVVVILSAAALAWVALFL
jgi:hypothetical protein